MKPSSICPLHFGHSDVVLAPEAVEVESFSWLMCQRQWREGNRFASPRDSIGHVKRSTFPSAASGFDGIAVVNSRPGWSCQTSPKAKRKPRTIMIMIFIGFTNTRWRARRKWNERGNGKGDGCRHGGGLATTPVPRGGRNRRTRRDESMPGFASRLLSVP